MESYRTKTLKNLVFLTFPSFIFSAIIAELILRVWFPVPDPYERFKNRYDYVYIPSQLPANSRYVFRSNEGLKGMDSVMTYTANNVGFRGDYLTMPKPNNEFRIFLIGGSTTQCLYLDDSKSIDHVLQTELQKTFKNKVIKVYNCGRSGDASPDHIAVLTQKVMHLQPNLVVIFSGFNDSRKAIQLYDYAHLTLRKSYSPKYLYLALSECQIFRRLYYLFHIRSISEIRESVPLVTNYKQLFQIQQQTPVSDSIPTADTSAYSINLASLTGTCRANGIDLIFMTNQSTWNSQLDSQSWRSHWMLTCGNVRYREEYLDEMLERFNNVMRNRAQSSCVPLLDLPKEMSKTQDYFYDDCHFNTTGALIAGKKLSELIINTRFVK